MEFIVGARNLKEALVHEKKEIKGTLNITKDELLIECSYINGYSHLNQEQRQFFYITDQKFQGCINVRYKPKWRA